MLNFIIAVIIVICTTYLGWGISRYYQKRILFFQNLDDFLNYACTNINFFKDSIDNIVLKFIDTHSLCNEFNDVLKKFIKHINLNSPLLKKNENHLLNDVFRYIGKNDSENQIAGLKNFSNQVNAHIKIIKEENKKIGSISTKLGFLLGLTIAICLI